MITICVACIKGVNVDLDRALSRGHNVRLIGRRGEKKEGEGFSIPVARELEGSPRLGTFVIKHKYQRKTAKFKLVENQIEQVESTENVVGLARVWFGYKRYILFWFRGDSTGKEYPYHRLLVAKCLLSDPGGLKQQLVTPIEYDLQCLQKKFPKGIWDQDFNRLNPIRRGRIRGPAMETDVLYYSEFSNIKSFIGITVHIPGYEEKVKVLTSGRIQFMSLQEHSLEDRSTSADVIERIFEVLNSIQSCEKVECNGREQ